MKLVRQMKYFGYVIILLAGCTSGQPSNKGDLSLIVLTDSLIAYQGNLNEKPAVEKIAFSWPNVKKLIDTKLGNDPARKILIKPANRQNAGGNTEELLTWCKDNQFNNYRLLAMDTVEEKYFHVEGIKFDSTASMTDSKPEPLHLFLPKDTGDTDNAKANDKTYTILLLKNNKVYIYNGVDMTKEIISTSMSDKKVRSAILDGKKKFGNDFFIIIKPSKEASYKNVVDMLDEMTINDIKRYQLSDISDAEISYTQGMHHII
jgi:biopolymer transport protein ExbD